MAHHAKKETSPVALAKDSQPEPGAQTIQKNADPLPGKSSASGAAKSSANQLPTVKFPKVDSITTPKEMTKQRIPPQAWTFLTPAIEISGGPVTISVANQGGGNGTVQIPSEDPINKTVAFNDGFFSIPLIGKEQTSPGSNDKLKLVAKSGDTVVSESNTFSVAAIPQNWTISWLNKDFRDSNLYMRGFRVMTKIESDSNSVPDLNEVSIAEQVQVAEKTGCFEPQDIPGVDALDYQTMAGATGSAPDKHRIPIDKVYGDGGTITANQVHIFKDMRTGVSEIPAKMSAFQIFYNVTKLNGPEAAEHVARYKLVVTKTGKSVTANGYTADGGYGVESSDVIYF
jgi:hypothetical protein